MKNSTLVFAAFLPAEAFCFFIAFLSGLMMLVKVVLTGTNMVINMVISILIIMDTDMVTLRINLSH